MVARCPVHGKKKSERGASGCMVFPYERGLACVCSRSALLWTVPHGSASLPWMNTASRQRSRGSGDVPLSKRPVHIRVVGARDRKRGHRGIRRHLLQGLWMATVGAEPRVQPTPGRLLCAQRTAEDSSYRKVPSAKASKKEGEGDDCEIKVAQRMIEGQKDLSKRIDGTHRRGLRRRF